MVGNKVTIRQELIKRRKQLQKETVLEKSRTICQKVIGLPEYLEASSIFTYLNFGNEVMTRPIIEDAWNRNKEVLLPVAEEGGKMYFAKVNSLDCLRKRKNGVWEPAVDSTRAVVPAKKDLFLIPGSVFDESGNRFGYGGGYYDRFLAENPQVTRTALCYDFQVLKKIPAEACDCRMQKIITEERIIDIKEE